MCYNTGEMRIRMLPAMLLLVGLAALGGCSHPTPAASGPGAVIIDGLQEKGQSPFAAQASGLISGFGLKVNYFSGEQVNIDLFRGLPAHGYKVIILRMHSGLLEKEGQLAGKTWLFTNEGYSTLKYVDERRTEVIVKARAYETRPWVFAIGPDFVRDKIEGKFGGAVIIAMGCYSLYFDDLARAFASKGAAAYIGWDGNLSIDHSDQATLELLKSLCVQKTSLNQAFNGVVAKLGADPLFGSRMVSYPPPVISRTLTDLIK